MRKPKGLRRNTPILHLIAQKRQRFWYHQLSYKIRCIRRTEYCRLYNFLYLILALYIALSVILFLIFPYWQSLCAATSTLISWTHAWHLKLSQPGWSAICCQCLTSFLILIHSWRVVCPSWCARLVVTDFSSLYKLCYCVLEAIYSTTCANFCCRCFQNTKPWYVEFSPLYSKFTHLHSLAINEKTTVQHVKLELRRRHLISNPTDHRTYMVIAPTQILPLQDHEVLYAIGVWELMTLQIRTKVLGGAPPADTAQHRLIHDMFELILIYMFKCSIHPVLTSHLGLGSLLNILNVSISSISWKYRAEANH